MEEDRGQNETRTRGRSACNFSSRVEAFAVSSGLLCCVSVPVGGHAGAWHAREAVLHLAPANARGHAARVQDSCGASPGSVADRRLAVPHAV